MKDVLPEMIQREREQDQLLKEVFISVMAAIITVVLTLQIIFCEVSL